jgi:hypothetical protein
MTFNIQPPANIASMFRNWLNIVAQKDKDHIRVDVCTLLWIYRKCEMTLSLTKKNVYYHFCRLFLWLRIESICDHIFSRWRVPRPWSLSVTVWQWCMEFL